MSPRTRNLLRDVAFECRRVVDLVGVGEQAKLDNELYELASERLLMNIGEALAQIRAKDSEILESITDAWKNRYAERPCTRLPSGRQGGGGDSDPEWRSPPQGRSRASSGRELLTKRLHARSPSPDIDEALVLLGFDP